MSSSRLRDLNPPNNHHIHARLRKKFIGGVGDEIRKLGPYKKEFNGGVGDEIRKLDPYNRPRLVFRRVKTQSQNSIEAPNQSLSSSANLSHTVAVSSIQYRQRCNAIHERLCRGSRPCVKQGQSGAVSDVEF